MTLINFIFMAIFRPCCSLPYRAQAPVISSHFTRIYGAVSDRGSGKWFYFPDDAVIFRQITIYRVKMKGGSDDKLREKLSPKRRRLWALSQPWRSGRLFYSAGIWHVAQYDRSPVGAMKVFLIFYIVCVLLTGWFMVGGNSAKNKRSMPDTFIRLQPCRIRQGIRSQFIPGQESCHE